MGGKGSGRPKDPESVYQKKLAEKKAKHLAAVKRRRDERLAQKLLVEHKRKKKRQERAKEPLPELGSPPVAEGETVEEVLDELEELEKHVGRGGKPPKPVANDTFKAFVAAVEERQTLDFPAIAKEVGLTWAQLQKKMNLRNWFLEELNGALQRIKYRLLEQVMKVSRGEAKGSNLPPAATLKYMIDLIDSGSLTGGRVAPIGEQQKLNKSALEKEFGLVPEKDPTA